LQLSHDLLVQFQQSFFLFCKKREELYNKKMLIKIELQNHKIIAKTFFFNLPLVIIWLLHRLQIKNKNVRNLSCEHPLLT
jgi:hypothetical protein